MHEHGSMTEFFISDKENLSRQLRQYYTV